jgi:vacuolar-type H+-ATPase subunit I/STV1
VNKQEEMHEVEAECGKKKDYRPLRQARSQERGGGMMKKEFSENFDSKKVVDEEECPNLTWTLKQKIKSIMRAIKKEEELEEELEEGINLLKGEIEEKGWEIKEQSETIEELREIREENMGECSRLLESIEEK